jgi:hypothetical protein
MPLQAPGVQIRRPLLLFFYLKQLSEKTEEIENSSGWGGN